jgi:hypothetical protein
MNPRIPPPKVAPLGIPVATVVDDEQVVAIFTYQEAAFNWLREKTWTTNRKLIEFGGTEIVLDSIGEVLRFD